MSTWRELIYMVMDELKLTSDDSFFNEEHVSFLLEKYRGLLLNQRYKDVRKEVPESNLQNICIDLERYNLSNGGCCSNVSYLRSTDEIPSLLKIYNPSIYINGCSDIVITYVNYNRLRYVGNNTWLSNIIYAAIGPDNHLYVKSSNPQFLYLEKVMIGGMFENPMKIIELSDKCKCEEDRNCDYWDNDFPIEEALIPTLIEMVVTEMSGAKYSPQDKANDSNDNLSDMQVTNGKGKK